MASKQVGKYVQGDMIQDSIVIKNTTTDEIIKLISQDKNEEAMEILKIQENTIGVLHPKYPYYSLGLKKINGNIIPYSKPMSKEAIEKYPLKIEGKFKLDKKYKDFKDINDLLDYSYKTQTSIEINEIELKKIIGEEIDPYQDEINMLLSNTKDWKIVPKEFPEARPYKIIIEGSDVTYDYILLRTTKIEGNKIYLSNKEQRNDVEFNFVLDTDKHKVSINMKINKKVENKNISILKYLKFMKGALNKSKFSIISLELDLILIEGMLDNFEYDSPFGNIDNEISFIEYVTLIEKQYKTNIKISEIIKDSDIENVYYLGEAIKYGEIRGTWKDVELNFIIDEQSISKINNFNDKLFSLSVVSSHTILLLEKSYIISKIIRTFKNASLKNLKKVKEKISAFEVGDVIKITFIANKDGKYIENFEF